MIKIEKCSVSKHLMRGIISSDTPTPLTSDCLSFQINKNEAIYPLSVFFNGQTYEFYFKFPTVLDKNDKVRILNASNGKILHSICIEDISINPIHIFAESIFSLPDWAIDNVNITEDYIEIDGWILKENASVSYEIQVNDVAIEVVATHIRSDVEKVFSNLGPLRISFGYKAKLGRSKISSANNNYYKFELKSLGNKTNTLIPSFYYPVKSVIEQFPLPDSEQVHRVYGTNSIHGYIKNGYTNYNRIKNIILSLFNNVNKVKILDWGCGCAGLGRYFINDQNFIYSGCDIDCDNINWCEKTVSERAFTEISTQPPTPYSNEQFDVVFGISVFSHLNEQNQFLWLNELYRILKPSGFALVSILGMQAFAKLPFAISSRIINEGFIFSASPHKIGEIIGDQNYYGTAYHAVDYIIKNWTKKFSLFQYRQKFLGHQDLVLLEKLRSK